MNKGSPISLVVEKQNNSIIKITPLEKAIIGLLYQGKTSAKSITLILKFSYRAVEEYIDNIKRKLSAKNRPAFKDY